MARDGIGLRRVGARRRWALVALVALAIAVGAVACGGGGGGGGGDGDASARWDTAVWGSARWAP